jgi:hypothetical protein
MLLICRILCSRISATEASHSRQLGSDPICVVWVQKNMRPESVQVYDNNGKLLSDRAPDKMLSYSGFWRNVYIAQAIDCVRADVRSDRHSV